MRKYETASRAQIGISSERAYSIIDLSWALEDSEPKESDIVERLRTARNGPWVDISNKVLEDAAKEIGRLREESSNAAFCFGCIHSCKYYTEEMQCSTDPDAEDDPEPQPIEKTGLHWTIIT